MSRVVVIGATGHVGSYLVPRLVRAGHEVVAVSRGVRDPYVAAPEWDTVTRVVADRDAEDATGEFGGRIAALAPDVVVDLVCFPPSCITSTPTTSRRPSSARSPGRPRSVRAFTSSASRR